MKTSNNAITALVVVLALAFSAAAYYLLYAPLMVKADDARLQAEQIQSQNQQQQIQLDDLKARYAALDETRAELEQIQVELSPDEDYQDVRRMIAGLASEYGVTLVGDSLAVPTYVVPGGSFALAAAVVNEQSYTEEIQFEGLFQTKIDLKVRGTYENVLRFVTALQYGDHRYLLVNAADLTPILGIASDSTAADANVLSLSVTFFTIDTTRIPADPSAVTAGSGVVPGSVPVAPSASPSPAAGSASPAPSAAATANP